jgi:hypothetical protein
MNKSPKRTKASLRPWLMVCVVGAGLGGVTLFLSSRDGSTPEAIRPVGTAPRADDQRKAPPQRPQGPLQGVQSPSAAGPTKVGSSRSTSPHYVPASQLQPPGPDLHPVPPPTPQVPLDPRTRQPPMHNPGGVEGDRPPRAIPGLEGSVSPP